MHEANLQINSAIEIATKSREENPADHQNACNLALFYVARGLYQKAQVLYEATIDKGASSERINIAIVDLNEYLKIFPDNEDARSIIAYLESQLDD